jgi:hypothetical protein
MKNLRLLLTMRENAKLERIKRELGESSKQKTLKELIKLYKEKTTLK